MRHLLSRWFALVLTLPLAGLAPAAGQDKPPPRPAVRDLYTKQEVSIPMRDGMKLFTSIYVPKDVSTPHPILLCRTPYSVGPYGADRFRFSVGPSDLFLTENYVVAYQDVRGRYMSEGEFENVRPHNPNKKSPADIDESTDTYDTVEWLVKNVPNNNGRVGMWGISYPGFYAAAGMIDAHPALKAVSPQAPIGDWFYDDFRHHGALFLPHGFNFMSGFGRPRPKPTTQSAGRGFSHGTPDGYQFFLELGPLKNANERYFKNDVAFWNTMLEHPNYDSFWQARNILPHLKKTAPAVMTVGGWYDAEDLYGACQVYRAVERQNPGIYNVFVMGPWRHGGWSRGDGDRLGNVPFGSKTAAHYREKIELPFFNHFLKDQGNVEPGEAHVFETGANRWRTFDHWPPQGLTQRKLHFRAGGGLDFDAAREEDGQDEFVSDPNKPVPYTEAIAIGMTTEYMTDDQRFAGRRPDVLVYRTDPLQDDVTVAGPVLADLWVATTGTDADWVVKLIDVFPNDTPNPSDFTPGRPLAGYQMMVRSEVIRGRFRNSYEKPEPFVPGQPARVKLPLQDVLHTFKKGHRIMVQVQSTWFPLVDRNPQKYVDNPSFADEKDFIKATHTVYRNPKHPSGLELGVLPAKRE